MSSERRRKNAETLFLPLVLLLPLLKTPLLYPTIL